MGTKARDEQMCRTLIKAAAQSGVDAVKFQLFRATTTYAVGSGPCNHLSQKGIPDDIGEVFTELELSYEWLPRLLAWCQEAGVELIVSTFSEADFAAVDPYVRIHKIASPELHHPGLLKLAARSGKPVLLSTGISTIEEIEWALGYFSNREQVVLLQCTVQYPAEPGSMNLRTLAELAKHFGCQVGLSDHSLDPVTAPVAATALGARVIEKHVTLHRSLVGPDHSWAITLEELTTLVRGVRLCETMLGSQHKHVTLQEEALRVFSRRSLQLLTHMAQGERFQLGVNFAVLRPGTRQQGVHPSLIEEIEGARAARDLAAGSGIQRGDWYCDC